MGNTAALVFGGQGSQFTGMGKRIYDSFSEARSVFVLASDVVGYDVATVSLSRMIQRSCFWFWIFITVRRIRAILRNEFLPG